MSRGFLGVTPRDVDADLERSLHLGVSRGAVIQNVKRGSPADRAGLRAYDVIVGLDDRQIASDDELIREIAGRAPGSAARVPIRPRRPRAAGRGEAGRAGGARVRPTGGASPARLGPDAGPRRPRAAARA